MPDDVAPPVGCAEGLAPWSARIFRATVAGGEGAAVVLGVVAATGMRGAIRSPASTAPPSVAARTTPTPRPAVTSEGVPMISDP
jgi:hypothetical protein